MYNPFSRIFRLGVKKIDDQHYELVELTNNLADAVKAKAPRETIACIVEKLQKFSAMHFAYEDKLMDENPDYEAAVHHKVVHVRLLKDLNTAVEKILTMDDAALHDAIWGLRECIIYHVLDTDKEFVDFLKIKGI